MMSPGKQFVYAWITYFLAFCGIAEFYFDMGSRRLVKSRLLRIYCRLLCAITFCCFCSVLFLHRKTFPAYITKSKLMTFLVCTSPIITLLAVLSCILCARLWQKKIFEMLKDLLRLDELIAESSYCAPPSEQPRLLRLFWIRLFILVSHTILMLLQPTIVGEKFIVFCSIIESKFIRSGLYYLSFNILWLICNNFVNLQSYLRQLLSDPMTLARKEDKVLEVYRIYYKLLRMTNEFCEIFKYPLGFYLLFTLSNACLYGYLICRQLVGKPLNIYNPMTEWLLMLQTFNRIYELLILTAIADMASELHDETLEILRSSSFDSHVLQRHNDWLALQLAWQNKKINLFGVLNINSRLIFLIVTNIALNIICIIQSDYNYL